ncbi:hypothetical protein [Calothrix sp. CCY 0018]|uniref:hypothetical protein n=1 Tax=Calothrix sp. CCY 0018 TaxID=3103864 RepID=UPI0039C6D333
MLHKPEASNQLALTLEQFVAAAEAFLQNHYSVGSDREDISKILRDIENLRLDIDTEQLEQEFGLSQEKKDLIVDFCIKF